jgi:hypothetical protein
MNPFHLTDYKYLFFDIFYKNNKLYLIAPIYSEPFDSDKIIITYNNNNNNNTLLQLSDKKIKNCGEPISIYIYDCYYACDSVNVEVKFYDIIRNYTLPHLQRHTCEGAGVGAGAGLSNIDLVLTTLFKDDYLIFPVFYEYYMKQGVRHFYMYYNGISTPKVKQLLSLGNVTLIDWPFQYWNAKNCKYLHHAQPGQVHHALYKYGKDLHDYMLFCDLDEYLYIPNTSLKEYISKNTEIDSFGFLNKWSKSPDNKPILSFPKRFLTSKGVLPYNHRSKNIHKTCSVDTIGIHMAHAYADTIKEPKLLIHNIMFHFYNWSKPTRENKDCPMEPISLHF